MSVISSDLQRFPQSSSRSVSTSGSFRVFVRFSDLWISPTFLFDFVILGIHVGCLVTGQEGGGGICLSFRAYRDTRPESLAAL